MLKKPASKLEIPYLFQFSLCYSGVFSRLVQRFNDLLGPPTVSSDHYFHTYCPFVCMSVHMSPLVIILGKYWYLLLAWLLGWPRGSFITHVLFVNTYVCITRGKISNEFFAQTLMVINFMEICVCASIIQ